MSRAITTVLKSLVLVVCAVAIVGCAGNKMKKENEQYKAQILQLQSDKDSAEAEAKRLADENAALQAQAAAKPAPATTSAADAAIESRAKQLKAEGFEVSVQDGMMIITMQQNVLYNSGSATISKTGKSKLMQVARALNSEFKDFSVEVQGHTDSDPIKRTKNKYEDNFALSYDRAKTVADYLSASGGVSVKRIHVAAFGQYRPVAANSGKDKAKNRRVEIIAIQPVGGVK